MTQPIRVRYAPSPTGYLHIGNARTALFNYLFARSQGGTFVIRTEDTDAKRNVEHGEENQFRYLKWLGIDWDEGADVGGEYGPYRQSERQAIYQPYIDQLLADGRAYRCYCTEEELQAEREKQRAAGETPKYSGKCRHLSNEDRKQLEANGRKPSIRFHVPAGKTILFTDMVKGDVSFESDGIGDFVIVKKDGIPTYNFAVIIDDVHMKISHVLRGDDHITNTPRQLLIAEALGLQTPTYGHMTLIVNEARKKLSKRDQSIIQYIEQYEERGYVPDALFNFIALLGWSPEGEEEIHSKEQLIAQFTAQRLSKSPAVFDSQKLTWMNGEYMKQLSAEQLLAITLPHMQKAGYWSADADETEKERVRQIVLLHQEKLQYGAEIVDMASLFFKDVVDYNEDAQAVLRQDGVGDVLAAFATRIRSLETYDAPSIKETIKAVQKETGQRGKKLFMPIRVACTGQQHGPDLIASLELLGREVVADRAEKARQVYC